MKIKILVLLTFVSINCLSQSIGDLKFENVILTNPIKLQFCVYQEDSVSMDIYNRFGLSVINVLPKDLYKVGTYKLEYTKSDSLKTDNYFYQIKSNNKKIQGSVTFLGFKGSSKPSDFLKITYIDSIKVFDTIRIAVFDTTKVLIIDTIKVNDTIKVAVFDTARVLIIDTLNCNKTNINLRKYKTFPISTSLVFHDNLTINFSGVDNLVIYDMVGKVVRKLAIDNYSIPLQDLKIGMYIGLFYQNGSIVQTIKMIKE